MLIQKVYDGTSGTWIEIDVDNPIDEQGELDAEKALKRMQRNSELVSTDWTLLSDTPFTAEQKEEIVAYRQSLRDLPDEEDFPNVDLPTKPDFL